MSLTSKMKSSVLQCLALYLSLNFFVIFRQQLYVLFMENHPYTHNVFFKTPQAKMSLMRIAFVGNYCEALL